MTHRTRRRRWPLLLLGGLLGLFGLILLLQTAFAHRTDPFRPDYPRVDLAPVLARETPLPSDYDALLRQTGLAPPAIDALWVQGETGKAQISLVQDQFWQERQVKCQSLFAMITMEDRLETADGSTDYGPYMPALEAGDVILTFATHSVGWRHGHAGIVLDADRGVTLEAAVIGSDTQFMNAGHWRSYSNFMVLRLREMTPALQAELVDFCIQSLEGTPYHLTSGVFGDKAPDPESPGFGVQCAYVVWYAFQHFGHDVDGDGGRIVTVADLAASPLFEVVQVYGIDPALIQAGGEEAVP